MSFRRLISMAKRGNGEGNITYIQSRQVWMGRIMVGYKPDGKINRKTVYGKTKKEVSEKLREIGTQITIGMDFDSATMLVSDWARFWLENFKKRTLKAKTYEVYEQFINLHIAPCFKGVVISKLTAMHIQKLVNDKLKAGLSTASIRKMYGIIHQFLAKAIENDIILKNPASAVELPEHKQKEIKVFSNEEQTKFFEAAKEDRLYDFFVLAVDTGIRLGEILALTWDDIDFNKGLIYINKNLMLVKNYEADAKTNYSQKVQDTPKTKSSIRKVPMTKRTALALKKRKIASSDVMTVFHTHSGQFLSARNVERSFCRLIEKAGIEKCNVHTLRHTFATRMFEIGVSAKIVSVLLGHSKVSHTLDIYTHVLPDKRDEAIKGLDAFYENQKMS
jgi:integrase